MNDIIHSGRADAQRRERHSWLPLPLLVLFNCVRISLCAAWTAVVGTVILSVIWPRYWYGRTAPRSSKPTPVIFPTSNRVPYRRHSGSRSRMRKRAHFSALPSAPLPQRRSYPTKWPCSSNLARV
jgi:hypothetical protein